MDSICCAVMCNRFIISENVIYATFKPIIVVYLFVSYIIMNNTFIQNMKVSRQLTKDTGLLHKIGIRRNIRINNSCNKKAYANHYNWC